MAQAQGGVKEADTKSSILYDSISKTLREKNRIWCFRSEDSGYLEEEGQ